MCDSYYVDLNEAAALLRERQHLRLRVEALWEQETGSFPTELSNLKPSAVSARQLVSWRMEDALFADRARQAKLPTFWYTYEGDRFSEISPLKRSYAQPQVVTGIDRSGTPIVVRQKLLKPMQQCAGKVLKDIVLPTQNGQTLPEWHKARWQRFYGTGVVIDATPHKLSWGNTLKRDYLGLMSLFIAHGVLFEDYHGGESGGKLDSFTADVFEPAFDWVSSYFGVKPLIVQMPWWPELAYYPSPEWTTQALVGSIPCAA